MWAVTPAFNDDEVSTVLYAQPPEEAHMIASRTTRFPNVAALSALLVLAVLATAALLRLTPVVGQATTGAESIAVPFPSYRLNEFHASPEALKSSRTVPHCRSLR